MPTTNPSNYVVVEDFLTPEECEAFCHAIVKNGTDDPKPNFKYLHIVNSGRDIDKLSELRHMGHKIEIIIDYAENHFLESYTILGDLEFSRLFGNIMEAGSHLPKHRDEDPNPEGFFDGKKRSFVGSLLLNDDYEGGELLFNDQNATLKPKKGTLVLFPGYYTSHGVAPITGGNRINLLLFFYDMTK